MSQLIVLGRNGGKQEFEWIPEKIRSVRAAQKVFEEKLSEGYAAFKIFKAASKKPPGPLHSEQIQATTMQQTVMGEQIHEFDSRAETIQMTPPMVGG